MLLRELVAKPSRRRLWIASVFLALMVVVSCRSKSDLKREQEIERLKAEVNSVRGEKADQSYATEELKQEIARLISIVEENAQLSQRRFEESVKRQEETQKELVGVNGRLEMIENRDLNAPPVKVEPDKKSFRLENGKKLYDAGKFEEAAEIFKEVARNRSRIDDARRAQFLFAECYFEMKDYASAALEYSEFKKSYPKDSQVPSAIYRQANAFRLMNRPKEAKLFYQELFERFPKHILTSKGKDELRKLK